MNNISVIVIALFSVGVMLIMRATPQQMDGVYAFAEPAARRSCPPKPQYERSERVERPERSERPEFPRWERVERPARDRLEQEPETSGTITTAYRRRSADE